ncbi:hypothetical protein ABG768_005201 [Culter alburnus]|uniref:SHSP domain-containing protein n=1 Tax=Culter alburnus TaxID=194366 RepID=A0AAW1ZRP1_CULAL
MLIPHGFQPSFRSLMGTEWPVQRSLCPEITALHRHAEVLQEERSSLEKLQQQIFEEIYPVSCAVERDGSRFALTPGIQEFRREFELPEGVNPEGLSCSMADDGKLYIQAPVNQRSEDAERKISTDCEAEDSRDTT